MGTSTYGLVEIDTRCSLSQKNLEHWVSGFYYKKDQPLRGSVGSGGSRSGAGRQDLSQAMQKNGPISIHIAGNFRIIGQS